MRQRWNDALRDHVRNFGHGETKFFATIVLGRSKFVDASKDQADRLKWRKLHVAIHGVQVGIITFDELYEFLRDRLRFIRGIAAQGDLE